MDDGCIDRDNAGALGILAERSEGADAGIVHAGAGSGVGGAVFGWVAWRRTAQDWLDACRGGGRCGAVAAASDPWPWPLGCGRASRHRARLCGRGAWRQRCGACYRRDRVPEAGQGLLRRRPPVYRRRARSQIAKSGCSRPMCRVMATPSSTALCIFQRRGRATRLEWRQRTCRQVRPLRPSPRLRFR